MIKDKYNTNHIAHGEDYSKVKSATQPEQVLPLRRILEGLSNGTIILDGQPQYFDIPEHTIEVAAGKTPEQTNANIAVATAADLAESAANAGEVITAHPGFQIEDVQEKIDAIEAVLSNVKPDGEQAAAQSKSNAADKPNGEALDNNAAVTGE